MLSSFARESSNIPARGARCALRPANVAAAHRKAASRAAIATYERRVDLAQVGSSEPHSPREGAVVDGVEPDFDRLIRMQAR